MRRNADKNRFLHFYAASVGLFLILALVGFFFADKWMPLARPPPAAKSNPLEELAYVRLPRMSISLGNEGFMQMRMNISLEVESKDVPILEGYIPQIVDRLNAYFPHVNFDELDRPHAMFLLHKNMLWQVNSVDMPIIVHDLMLQNMVIW